MGLTIHYELVATAQTIEPARALVAKLRSRALDLPFAEVGEIIELKGDDCHHTPGDHGDPHGWLKTQALHYLMESIPGGGGRAFAAVVPSHIIAFTIVPGEGCEDANIGLCRYPASIVSSEGTKLQTGLTGWSWGSFCKTQYASNPDCGGIPNFLKCHLGVIKLLDFAKELGILKKVKDEGQFWDKRDVPGLIKELGEWNAMIAGAFGAMKDALEAVGQDATKLRAAIAEFPNFEHLEADDQLRRESKA